jgi:hypothetical protein
MRRSPFLPTATEAVLLAFFPTILLLGSLSSILSPRLSSSSLHATYSPTQQSYQPASLAPSYFARKSNILNVYFVKVGWLWTSLALVALLATFPRHTVKSRAQAVARFGLATGLWFLTTQWFFGPPLIDRSFRLSGGACQAAAAEKAGEVHVSRFEHVLTNAECKLQGGTWSGGIDISGHVFLLVLGSSILLFEMLPFLGSSTWSEKQDEGATEQEALATSIAKKFVFVVVGLMFWMLLMTATFFHTWTEKLAGLVVALSGVWIVYFLPRGRPEIKAILGVPGHVA